MIAHRTVGRDGSIRVLYGRTNEPSPNRNARDGTGGSNHPQSGATSTKPHDARTLTVGTAFGATTGDGLAANVGPMQERTVFNNARARAAAREAWLLRTGRRHDPDDPDGRSSQMRSVLRRLPQPRSKRRSGPRGRDVPDPREAARHRDRDEMPQPARNEKRSGVFFSVRITPGFSRGGS